MKNYVKKGISIILFLAAFVACGEFWRYLLIDDTESYTRVMMRQMYQEESIDVLFVGSSHVYQSIVPEIMDESLDCRTFNAGTSSQSMDGSLALIKEAAARHDLQHVYLELYYDVSSSDDYKTRTELTNTYIISDYMRPSLRKVEYLIQASDKAYWINSFVIPRRNWSDFFNEPYVRNLFLSKRTHTYKAHTLPKLDGASQYYVDRGFVANDSSSPKEADWIENAYGAIQVYESLPNSDWENSLFSIMRFCKARGIGLSLFVAPERIGKLAGKGDYQNWHDYIQGLADRNGVKLYDFNLCSSEYFDANNHALFRDEQHVNTLGATEFSRLFGGLITGRISEESLFYDTFEEKLNDEAPTVYGLAELKNNVDEGTREGYIISNRTTGMEYSIVATSEAGIRYQVQDYDENKRFSLPLGEKGVLTIEWRQTAQPNAVSAFEVAY